jgi:hypothetical protein
VFDVDNMRIGFAPAVWILPTAVLSIKQSTIESQTCIICLLNCTSWCGINTNYWSLHTWVFTHTNKVSYAKGFLRFPQFLHDNIGLFALQDTTIIVYLYGPTFSELSCHSTMYNARSSLRVL